MSASEGKADPYATRIKRSQMEGLLFSKADVQIGRNCVKLGSAFGQERT